MRQIRIFLQLGALVFTIAAFGPGTKSESLNIPGADYQGSAHVCLAGQACRRFQLLPMVGAYRR